MNSNFVFSAAEVSDCKDIARLFSEAVPQDLHSLTVATQAGYARYLEAQTKWRGFLPNNHITVARNDTSKKIVACASFTLLDERNGFLSYIAVESGLRGLGLGTAIIENFLSERPDLESISLDVFASNSVARKMYERLGFEVSGRTFWHTRPIPVVEELIELDVLNAPAAEAQLALYGFTKFETIINRRAVSIGQIGASTIRAFESNDFADPVFVSAASRLAPRAMNVLHIGTLHRYESVGAILAAESLRMTWKWR